ncbi:hypothetical protein [Niastella populi]|nr:hypothetical protein [Niastella populi]
MVAAMLLFALFTPVLARAGEEPAYDEIIVFLNVPQVGGLEVPAVIHDQELYLSVTDVFNFLKIKNSMSAGMDSVTGFFVSPQAAFVIDKVQNRISYKEHVIELDPGDLIRTETSLYLKSEYFGKVFELACTFNFRSLSATIDTKLDIPVIREMRQEMIRRNISQLKREVKADTTIRRESPFFRFGMADWSVVATKHLKGLTDTRLNLTTGSIIAGGEATVSLTYQNNFPFGIGRQYYLWRFVNNEHRFIRQIRIGKITTPATASILAPVVGVQVTNTPTSFRRSFGTYTVSDFTEPGWMVELYVNNVMVNYVKADASGFFTFEVPLVYGSSLIKLRFYGPWGEERSSERNIIIPFNLLPGKELEYTISAGMLEDSTHGRFAKTSFNYGLNRRMTVGWGMEYLSSVTSGKCMPYLNTSLRLTSNLLFSGEYTHGVRSKGVLSYRLPSSFQFELNYSKYAKGQQAINNRFFEERKITLSTPLRTPHFVLFSRLTLNQIIAPQTSYSAKTRYRDIAKMKYTSADVMFTGTFYRLSSSLTTYGLFTDQPHPFVYSNFLLAYMLPAKFVFKPQAQFQHNQSRFMTMKFELEKQLLGNGFLNISYEKNFQTQISNMTIGLRYDFPFARTAFSASRTNKTTTLIQSTSGSLIHDGKTKYSNFGNRSGVGRGGIVILPFLDLNCNGQRESNEPKIPKLKFRINGGRIVTDSRDSTIRVLDLEPYSKYFIELDGNSLDNIAWQIKKKILSVDISPNQLKLIEIPIAVVGEAMGMVYLNSEKGLEGQGRIIVSFYNSDSMLVGKTLTESDGFFSYLGLSPGSYKVRIDADQLQKLQLASFPAELPITIVSSKEGTIADELEFKLESLQKNTSQKSVGNTIDR